MPGPISSTRSPGSTPASRTMRRAVFGSARKFCPSARLGARPCRSRSAGIVAGVSANAVPGQPTMETGPGSRRCRAAPAARTRRGSRSMMWPVHASGPRSPTRHCAVLPVRGVADRDDRAERQASGGRTSRNRRGCRTRSRSRDWYGAAARGRRRRRLLGPGALGAPAQDLGDRRLDDLLADHGPTARSGRPCGPRSRTRAAQPVAPGLDRARCGRRRSVGSSRYSVGNGMILSSITVSGAEPVDVHGHAVGEAGVERGVHLVVRTERDLARREQLARR